MNFWRRRKYESWLVPYADGTLDGRRRTELETALSHDPTLAANAETQRRIAGRLRGAVLTEDTVPESEASRLWPQIQTRISPKRRSAAPLIWAGGACAAACLGWAAVWGPLGQPAQPLLNSMPPAIMANGTADQLPTSLLPTKHHGKRYKPRMSVKITRHQGESLSSLASPTAPIESQEMASAERNTHSIPPPESTATSLKPVVSAGGSALFQSAVGIHEYAPANTNNGAATGQQAQSNIVSEKQASALIANVSAEDSKAATFSADVASNAGKQKSTATPARKLSGQRHRRSHRRSIAASSKSASDTARKTSLINNSAPMSIDDTPKPIHILAKPVD